MIIGRCVSDDREMNVSCLGVFVSNMNSAYYALLAGSFVLPLSRSTNQQPVRHRQSLSARRFRCLILQRCRGGITTTPGSPPATQLSAGSLGNNFQRLCMEMQEGHKHGIMKHLEEKLSIRSLDTSSGTGSLMNLRRSVPHSPFLQVPRKQIRYRLPAERPDLNQVISFAVPKKEACNIMLQKPSFPVSANNISVFRETECSIVPWNACPSLIECLKATRRLAFLPFLLQQS